FCYTQYASNLELTSFPTRRSSDLIYDLSLDDLLGLEKFAEKSARNLLTAIDGSKGVELWRLLHGLGIPQVGSSAAKDLAKAFGGDRKSTRLNSSHVKNSYAVFCWK